MVQLVTSTETSASLIVSRVRTFVAVAVVVPGIVLTVRFKAVHSSSVADGRCCNIAVPCVCKIASDISCARSGFLPSASRCSSVMERMDAHISLSMTTWIESRSRIIFFMIWALSSIWKLVTMVFVSVTRSVSSVNSSSVF
jgi:hypothetical protein